MEKLVKKSMETLNEFKVEITAPNQAFQASLSILLQHVADFHIALVESISEHYSIDADEIITIIREHPKMKEIAKHPLHEITEPLERPKIIKFSKKLKKPVAT